MAKLTETQRIVLSKAAAREDGAAVVPANLAEAAAAKIGARLVARKLMRAIRSKPEMPVWREDETGKSIITGAGRDAIAMDQAQKIDWSVWKLIRDHYDAGGYSGGTMKRPALHRLLEVIGAGRIAP